MARKIYTKIKNYFFPSKQVKRVNKWIEAKGEQLRFQYPSLGENAVIFDLGGYEGQWASDIFSRYRSNLFVFEPYTVYAQLISDRFSKNDKIQVFAFGLGKKDSIESLYISENSSSVFTKSNHLKKVDIQIFKAADFFYNHKIDFIDLMKVNIEGGEYDLLEGLIENGLTARIRNIQVQFHDFVPNAYERMKNIQLSLSKTHKITYQFEFVWENWELNE